MEPKVTKPTRFAEQTQVSRISRRIGNDFTGGGAPGFKSELPGRASNPSKTGDPESASFAEGVSGYAEMEARRPRF
jgi:hypothetical protein